MKEYFYHFKSIAKNYPTIKSHNIRFSYFYTIKSATRICRPPIGCYASRHPPGMQGDLVLTRVLEKEQIKDLLGL